MALFPWPTWKSLMRNDPKHVHTQKQADCCQTTAAAAAALHSCLSQTAPCVQIDGLPRTHTPRTHLYLISLLSNGLSPPSEAPYLATSWRRHGSCRDHCWASHTGLPPCSDRGGITVLPGGRESGGGQTKFPSRCVVPLVVRPWPHSEDVEAFLRWPVKNVLSYASCL